MKSREVCLCVDLGPTLEVMGVALPLPGEFVEVRLVHPHLELVGSRPDHARGSPLVPAVQDLVPGHVFETTRRYQCLHHCAVADDLV